MDGALCVLCRRWKTSDFELTADEMAKLTAATSPQTGPTSGDCDVL